MKIQRWQIRVAVLLITLTFVFYGVRWIIFPGPDLHNEMVRYLIDDVAFLFFQVLLVTMFIDQAMQARAREELSRKLNMVIGAFFAETGRDLLGKIASADTRLAEVRDDLVAKTSWGTVEFARAREAFKAHDAQVSLATYDLVGLRDMLQVQRSHLLSLLTNQALLEHESFTDLLWAITHLAEELASRTDLEDLPDSDRMHLEGDTKRAYVLLGAQWIDYLHHLKTGYPYLFSLAVRTNPLDPEALVEIQA